MKKRAVSSKDAQFRATGSALKTLALVSKPGMPTTNPDRNPGTIDLGVVSIGEINQKRYSAIGDYNTTEYQFEIECVPQVSYVDSTEIDSLPLMFIGSCLKVLDRFNRDTKEHVLRPGKPVYKIHNVSRIHNRNSLYILNCSYEGNNGTNSS